MSYTADCALVVPYPAIAEIEGISVAGFPNPASLFARVVEEVRQPGQRLVHYLNIHVANSAYTNPELKRILQASDLVYCDGAGIVAGSRLLGNPLPTRLTAADWFLEMLAYFAQAGCSVYLLGGEPGVPEQALRKLDEVVPRHSVIGAHHGFILTDPELENTVIAEINRLQPDILIVGFGTPLQERWMERNRHRLNVPVLYAIGAVMDFISGKVSRCPQWMGNAGFEWLYRLGTEPSRLLGRYVLGNPWFLSRVALQAISRYFRFSRLPVVSKRFPFSP